MCVQRLLINKWPTWKYWKSLFLEKILRSKSNIWSPVPIYGVFLKIISFVKPFISGAVEIFFFFPILALSQVSNLNHFSSVKSHPCTFIFSRFWPYGLVKLAQRGPEETGSAANPRPPPSAAKHPQRLPQDQETTKATAAADGAATPPPQRTTAAGDHLLHLSQSHQRHSRRLHDHCPAPDRCLFFFFRRRRRFSSCENSGGGESHGQSQGEGQFRCCNK